MHALLSPSSAKRWMQCPASVPMGMHATDEESPFALEGTFAHAVAECKLKGDPIPEDLIAKIKKAGFDFDEIDKQTNKYVDFIDLSMDDDARLYVETKVPLQTITGEKDAQGTTDAAIVSEDSLSIFDLKYGKGVQVEAENNPQLLIYAAAFMRGHNFLKPKRVSMHIIQPRLNNVSSWTLYLGAFVEEIKKIKERAAVALAQMRAPESDWIFSPGSEACQFCKARGRCKALTNAALECIGEEIKGPAKMENKELAASFEKAELVKKWLKAIEIEVHNSLMRGENIPGFKLVEGRAGNREWDDARAVNAFFDAHGIGEERFEKKLVSPTQAEKQFKGLWPELSKRIVRSPGRPIVAPETDKRPEYGIPLYPDNTKGKEK